MTFRVGENLRAVPTLAHSEVAPILSHRTPEVPASSGNEGEVSISPVTSQDSKTTEGTSRRQMRKIAAIGVGLGRLACLSADRRRIDDPRGPSDPDDSRIDISPIIIKSQASQYRLPNNQDDAQI